MAVVTAVFVLLAAMLALAVTSGPSLVERVTGPTGDDRQLPVELRDTASASAVSSAPVGGGVARAWEPPGWLTGVALVLGLALAGLVAVAVWRWLQDRSTAVQRLDPRRYDVTPGPLVIDEERAAEQQARLAQGDPRNAIVACWVELESLIGAAGLPRDPAETPTELAQRVLARQDVPADAVDGLLRAYREARFSSHPITESDRASASAALVRIHAALGGPR